MGREPTGATCASSLATDPPPIRPETPVPEDPAPRPPGGVTAGSCAVCGARLVLPRVAGGEAVHGAVSATVEGVRETACPDGHDPLAAVPELVAALGGAVDRELLVARRTRVRRTLRCGACDAALTIPGRRTTRSVATTVTGSGVVRVTLDVPMLRCPECGLQQLPPEVAADDVPAVLSAALA